MQPADTFGSKDEPGPLQTAPVHARPHVTRLGLQLLLYHLPDHESGYRGSGGSLSIWLPLHFRVEGSKRTQSLHK